MPPFAHIILRMLGYGHACGNWWTSNLSELVFLNIFSNQPTSTSPQVLLTGLCEACLHSVLLLWLIHSGLGVENKDNSFSLSDHCIPPWQISPSLPQELLLTKLEGTWYVNILCLERQESHQSKLIFKRCRGPWRKSGIPLLWETPLTKATPLPTCLNWFHWEYKGQAIPAQLVAILKGSSSSTPGRLRLLWGLHCNQLLPRPTPASLHRYQSQGSS